MSTRAQRDRVELTRAAGALEPWVQSHNPPVPGPDQWAREGEGTDGGRACPLSYRTGPDLLAESTDVEGVHTLLVVGGLYGNVAALAAVMRRAEAEDAHVVFNGDFNFFNKDAAEWALVNNTIQRGCRTGRIHAIAGNVEIEVTGVV